MRKRRASRGGRQAQRFPESYWDPSYKHNLYAVEFLATDWQKKIRLDPPPDPRDSGELAIVQRRVRLRTPDVLADIERQATADMFYDFTKRLLLRLDSHPRTYEILYAAQAVGEPLVMHYKDRFMRARPVQYDPEIFPVIETPGHPAYPSGHATQAHLMAYGLGHVRPGLQGELSRLAWSIALNRETAGVHFRKDSEAGRSLAQQAFKILLGCPRYQALLAAAKREG
jgi:acid phosphatase (class A)